MAISGLLKLRNALHSPLGHCQDVVEQSKEYFALKMAACLQLGVTVAALQTLKLEQSSPLKEQVELANFGE
ncbi:hypothetical protein CDAR_296621 [Caerostris darwini]|uniref:Uncharacterized protein n=1 Tax=Caerostris darwini TaxID=1538125 RepID=A0AAV4QJG8_9ARAC|nr:hypothetical protein CDAR_296621 [Caerostris darwini]